MAFMIVGSVSSKEEANEIQFIAKHVITGNAIRGLAHKNNKDTIVTNMVKTD